MSFAIKPRMRVKVQCFCDKCEGELVDLRMKTKHKELMSRKIKYQDAGLSGLPDKMDDNKIYDDKMYDNGQKTGPSGLPDEIGMYDNNGQEAGPSRLPGLSWLSDEMHSNIEVNNNKTDDDALELPKRNYNFLIKKLGS